MSRISSYCHISNESIIINNDEVFAENKTGIKDLVKEAYLKLDLNYPKFYKMDTLSKVAFLGVEILKKHYPDINNYGSDEIALMFSNQYSSEDTDKKFTHSYQEENAPSPALFVYTLPNILIGEIAIKNSWYGENLFVVLPDFDADFFANYCNILISKTSQAVIGGWVNVLDENINAFLFFAEKEKAATDLILTSETIENIYKTKHNGKTKRRIEKTNH
jgi:hypothetical protein